MSLGLLILGISTSPWIIFLGVGLMALSFNISMPTVTGLASQKSSEEDQGNLMGTLSSVTYFGSLSGPVIGNALYSISMRGNYLIASSLTFVAMIFFTGKMRTDNSES